jgi:GNAT superfamily N-acetyltransferase
MTSSARMCLRMLEDTDYRNTKNLMRERFCETDTQCFVDLWKWRNYGASLCIEFMGSILGFGLVVENKLEYLVVSEEFDGRGFGRLLVRYILDQLRYEYRSCYLLTANDPRLRGWYSKQGFELSSSSCDSNGIWGDTMVCRFRTKRQAAAKVRSYKY